MLELLSDNFQVFGISCITKYHDCMTRNYNLNIMSHLNASKCFLKLFIQYLWIFVLYLLKPLFKIGGNRWGGKQKLSHSSIYPVTSRDEKISFQIFITFSFKPFATLL